MTDKNAVLNAADRMREFMESADRGMARVPVGHLSEWRQMLSDLYRAEVERVNRATDAEIGGIHRSFASPSPPPSAGVDAVAVKALVWVKKRKGSGTIYTAEGVDAAIVDNHGLGFRPGVRWNGTEYRNVEEAKAAAQADYEQRIRSALTPASAPVEPRCTICNDTGVTSQRFGMGTSPGECPVCSRADPTPVEAAGEANITKEMIEAGRKAIADERHRVGLQYPDTLAILAYRAMHALAKPAPAVEAVREALAEAQQFIRGNFAMGAEGSRTNAGKVVDRITAALAPAAQAGTVAQEGER